MDDEVILGYLMALAWLGLFVYIPISDIRRAGSVGAWLSECGRDPIGSMGGVLIAVGCCAFLMWLLTDGVVSVRLVLLAPAGFVVLVLHHSFRGSGPK